MNKTGSLDLNATALPIGNHTLVARGILKSSMSNEVVWKSAGFNFVGGRIFYIDESVSGANYAFFDENENLLSTHTIAGLEHAYYYIKTGNNVDNKNKFYVYDNTNSIIANKDWTYYDTSTENWVCEDVGVTSDGVGLGKSNTATIMSKDNGAYIKSKEQMSKLNDTVWYYLKSCIDNNIGGCDDWFIGSKAEHDQLRISGLVDWYDSKNIWSSVEYNSTDSYSWSYSLSSWKNDPKYFGKYVCLFRAF